MKLLTLGFLIFWVGLEEGKGEILCKLQTWTPSIRFPGGSVPEMAVTLAGSSNYSFIAKTTIGEVFLGTAVDKTDMKMFIPHPSGSGKSYESKMGEILINPDKCPLKWIWVTNAPPPFAVKVEGQFYIGRAVLDGIYFVGKVTYSGSIPELVVADTETVHTFSKDFEVLISASPGITATITNFRMDDIDPTFTGANAIASEEIRNNADVEVEQSFKHSKTIREYVHNVVYNTQTWVSGSCTQGGWSVWFWGKSYSSSYSMRYTEETWKETKTEKITVISVDRIIRVPPQTSIQACSMVTIKDNVNLTYVADTEYTAPTLTADEIIDILANDPDHKVTGVIKINDKATKVGAVSGYLAASLAMDSAFYINDLNKTPNATCATTAYAMSKNREIYVNQRKNRKHF